jgi:hypothetical protein
MRREYFKSLAGREAQKKKNRLRQQERRKLLRARVEKALRPEAERLANASVLAEVSASQLVFENEYELEAFIARLKEDK